MNCLRIREEIKAYIDGELGPIARWRVGRHLARCADCRTEMSAMTDLTNNVKSIPEASVPSTLRGKVLGKLEFGPVEGARPRRLVINQVRVAMVLIVAGCMAALMLPLLRTNRAMLHGGVDVPSSVRQASDASLPPRSRSAAVGQKTDENVVEGKPVGVVEDFSLNARGKQNASPASPAPMIIKSADVTVKVKSFQIAYDNAVSICKSEGGYVTNSSASSDEGTPTEGTLTLRIPATAFERVIERLGHLGTIKNKNVTGQDVTGEAVDLESRLRNKRAEERQYLDIMNRAKRIPDIVTVTNELSRVRGEIEEADGRLKYLKSAAAMATINLTLSEKEKPKPAAVSPISQSFSSAVASLAATGSALASLAIWLAVYSPFWALPIAAWIVIRRRSTSTVSS